MPATRRSSGWLNGGIEGTDTMDYVLEHLEQFKRKHIAQNRDVIKSNAFLQIRIRELEERIQQLEAERNRVHFENCQLRSRGGSDAARRVWLDLGRAMGFMDPSSSSSSQRLANQHITLDPDALPPGIARAVAKAPEIEQIREELEEGGGETEGEDQEERRGGEFESEKRRRVAQEEEEPRRTAPTQRVQPAPTASAAAQRKKTETMKGRQQQRKSTITRAKRADSEEAEASSPPPPEQPLPPPAAQPAASSSSTSTRTRTLPAAPSSSSSRARSSSPLESSAGEEEAPAASSRTRASRRSSVRTVNYALPKLNTKMRKPDPEDTKPAPSTASSASSARSSLAGTDAQSSPLGGDLKDLKRERQASPKLAAPRQPRLRHSRSSETLPRRNANAPTSRSSSLPRDQDDSEEAGHSEDEQADGTQLATTGDEDDTIVGRPGAAFSPKAAMGETLSELFDTQASSSRPTSALDTSEDDGGEESTVPAAPRAAPVPRSMSSTAASRNKSVGTSSSSTASSSSSSSSSGRRPSSSSGLSSSSTAGGPAPARKQPRASALTDADWAMLTSGASSTANGRTSSSSSSSTTSTLPPSLADLASTALWPSTPQINGGHNGGRVASGGGAGSTALGGQRKVSALSKSKSLTNLGGAGGGGAGFVPSRAGGMKGKATGVGNGNATQQAMRALTSSSATNASGAAGSGGVWLSLSGQRSPWASEMIPVGPWPRERSAAAIGIDDEELMYNEAVFGLASCLLTSHSHSHFTLAMLEETAPTASTATQTETLLLSVPSLHCSSCVSAIQQTLSPHATSIDVDVPGKTVTLDHSPAITPVSKLAALLQEIGYRVADVQVLEHGRASSSELTMSPHSPSAVLDSVAGDDDEESVIAEEKRRHHAHCKACQDTLNDPRLALDVIVSSSGPRTKRVDLSIEGMTCSSCVGGITKALRGEGWITGVDVALLTNSASVAIDGSHDPQEVVELIEDLGYGASVEGIELLGGKEEETGEKGERREEGQLIRRTATIQLKGFHCPRCPQRVIQALHALNDDDDTRAVSVHKAPTEADPTVEISYLPHAPGFTIRRILQHIATLDPAFTASLRQPTSPEDRANAIRARERRGILLRVVLTLVLAIPTFVVGVVFMSNLAPSSSTASRYFSHRLSGVMRSEWILLALSTPVYLFAADVFHRRAAKTLWVLWRPASRTPVLQRFLRFGSMDVLISLGVTVAYFASLGQVAATASRSGSTGQLGMGVKLGLGMDMGPGSGMPGMDAGMDSTHSDSYFDSVVFLTLFLLLGRLLEALSKAKTGETVAKLGTLRPNSATLAEGGEVVSAELLEVGDVVTVPHGASPPWDGTLVDEQAQFSEATLTGESMPVSKASGAPVYSGTINLGSPVSVRITAASGKSLLDQVIDLVRQGQTRRAPVEDLADKLTAHFVPVIVLIALTTWLVWLALGLSGRLPSDWLDVAHGGWPFWSLQFAIAVFVVACPCGIGLAAPTAIYVGGGLAAEHGILAKGGGEAFQLASQIDAVIFDKTGTLTRGEVVIADFVQLDDAGERWDEQTTRACLSLLEGRSSHPIARAVCDWAGDEAKESGNVEMSDVVEVPGKGVRGVATTPDGRKAEVMVGNEAMLQQHEVAISPSSAGALQGWKQQGKSVLLFAGRHIDSSDLSTPWQLLAILSASDTIRPEAPSVVTALESRGIHCWMLSGDNRLAAASVARIVGIDPSRVVAEVLPEQKVEQVKRIRTGDGKGRRTVAMVGDGINDSPALALADVGIAIGTGSDVAISAASFVLLNANLRTLLVLFDLSRAVLRRVKSNFFWAILYNAVALPVAAGVLYPVVAGGKHVRLDPVWASLAMALSSVSVVCSSLLLRVPVPVLGWRSAVKKQVDLPPSFFFTDTYFSFTTCAIFLARQQAPTPAVIMAVQTVQAKAASSTSYTPCLSVGDGTRISLALKSGRAASAVPASTATKEKTRCKAIASPAQVKRRAQSRWRKYWRDLAVLHVFHSVTPCTTLRMVVPASVVGSQPACM
ncbi:heavy metal translocatin [Jaminaea rosea]|uniref:Heavy metal translocatin n=1 Tax=Jaminaea rosea TaxID=1569628 RepID=A0A316V1K8_9BASI|nr:heavy metal translocatin [Jaminaea rosea]PWN31144.1 heavy metal translocatin [Jaminaea rosea]